MGRGGVEDAPSDSARPTIGPRPPPNGKVATGNAGVTLRFGGGEWDWLGGQRPVALPSVPPRRAGGIKAASRRRRRLSDDLGAAGNGFDRAW